MPEEMPVDSFSKLHRKTAITASNRFHASVRLSRHNQWSLWTITLFSLGLILVSLAQAFSLKLAFSANAVNVVSIFFTVAILTISIILSMSNYGSRSERLHDCGRELEALTRNLYWHVIHPEEGDKGQYDSLAKQYEEILSKYENHSKVDYRFTKLEMPERFPEERWVKPFAYFDYAMHFSLYVLLMGAEVIWLILLLRPNFS